MVIHFPEAVFSKIFFQNLFSQTTFYRIKVLTKIFSSNPFTQKFFSRIYFLKFFLARNVLSQKYFLWINESVCVGIRNNIFFVIGNPLCTFRIAMTFIRPSWYRVTMALAIEENQLLLDGCIYLRSTTSKGRIYWHWGKLQRSCTWEASCCHIRTSEINT